MNGKPRSRLYPQERKDGGGPTAHYRRSRPFAKFTSARKDDWMTMIQALRIALSAEQLEVAVWFYFDGFTLREIRTMLGCSLQAVVLRIRRIDAKLNAAGFPLPVRLEHPYAISAVGNYNLK